MKHRAARVVLIGLSAATVFLLATVAVAHAERVNRLGYPAIIVEASGP